MPWFLLATCTPQTVEVRDSTAFVPCLIPKPTQYKRQYVMTIQMLQHISGACVETLVRCLRSHGDADFRLVVGWAIVLNGDRF